MNLLTGVDKRDQKLELSVPATINSKITFIPAKNDIMEIVQPVKIPLKCLCQLDLLQRPP